jgi:hypothetical protein
MSDFNLCDTCRLEFATCPAFNVIFGIDRNPDLRGAEADAVLECLSYKPNALAPPEEQK